MVILIELDSSISSTCGQSFLQVRTWVQFKLNRNYLRVSRRVKAPDMEHQAY